MSYARSPRDVLSMTVGMSMGDLRRRRDAQPNDCVSARYRVDAHRATDRLHDMSESQASESQISESRQQIDLDATVDEVWRSLTDPDELAEWLDADVDLDVAPAGAGRITEPDGTVRQVLVTDVDPGR